MFTAKCTHGLANEYDTGDANYTFSAVKCSTRLSLIRSVIHAAHRKGERDATNRREWPLATIIATIIWQKNTMTCMFRFCILVDCITDHLVVCDDLLRYCPHCWRVQRHGCFLRAEKQVGWALGQHLHPLTMWLFLSPVTGETCCAPLLQLQ